MGADHRLRGCAVPTCPEVIDRSFLMCTSHWLMVPKPIRRRVQKSRGRAYTTAVRDAVESVLKGVGA